MLCRGISFSYDTRPDAGMYDAIKRGFVAARDDQPCVMTWVNADDFLMPGSLAAISSFLEQHPSAQLVGGRTALANQSGFLTDVAPPTGYQRDEIAAGMHDGRTKNFIMQEGTFWRSELWDEVNGLDENLRYAGDFDLWRRFSGRADYVMLDTVTACHRKRAGQLSANMQAYHAEIDSRLAGQTIDLKPKDPVGWYAYDIPSQAWRRQEPRRRNWQAISGISVEEGPYPSIGVENARWMTSKNAQLAVKSDVAGRCKLTIAFRNPFKVRKIEVAGVSRILKPHPMNKRLMVSVPFQAKIGWNLVHLNIDRLISLAGDARELGIFIEGAYLYRSFITHSARQIGRKIAASFS